MLAAEITIGYTAAVEYGDIKRLNKRSQLLQALALLGCIQPIKKLEGDYVRQSI